LSVLATCLLLCLHYKGNVSLVKWNWSFISKIRISWKQCSITVKIKCTATWKISVWQKKKKTLDKRNSICEDTSEKLFLGKVFKVWFLHIFAVFLFLLFVAGFPEVNILGRGQWKWVLIHKDKTILELASGDGCTTLLSIPKVTRLYNLKGWIA
jgi:hypothetical protein